MNYSDKLVRIWSILPGELEDEDISFSEKSFSPLDGHKYSVHHVEFSPCGTMLASSSLDGTTIIWDTEVMTVEHNYICYTNTLFAELIKNTLS